MAKRRSPEPHVRKSVYIWGGVVVGVALLGFALTTFVGGGGGAGDKPLPTTAPIASQPTSPSTGGVSNGGLTVAASQGLRPGGRDPFQALVAANAPAAEPVAAATPEPEQVTTAGVPVTALKYMMLYKIVFNGQAAYIQYDDSGARQLVGVADKTLNGYVVESIGGDCAEFSRDGKTLHLCTGDKAPL